MINELLRDLINTGKVAVFIDDVIVGTETKEGHDEIVAEVIRRLEENDLYVKLEKCRWKVKEVGFLEVVIGPEGIKMEEEKVKGVIVRECEQTLARVRVSQTKIVSLQQMESM